MRTSISNANMCQPGADYVCDWKPLDNALHASSFPHLVFYTLYIYIYICEDEKTSLLELRENECNEICWVGRAVDLIRYIHIFFSLFFLSNANRVSFHLSFFFSPDWWQHFLVVLIPIIEMDQPVSSHLSFFSLRAFTESFVFSRLGRSFFFFGVFFYTLLSYAPIHPLERFFFLRCLFFFSRCPPPRNKKKTRASANAVDERPERTRE